MTTILGLSAWYHDSACALLRDGEVVAAAQEERFSRLKGDAEFPTEALRYCCEAAGIQSLGDIDYLVFHEKPFIKFERLLETHLDSAPRGLPQFCQAMPSWMKQKLFARHTLEKSIRLALGDKTSPFPPLLFSDHHLSHAAMAFYPSPFTDAAVLCLDGVGEWHTTSAWSGQGRALTPLWNLSFPHSLGLLYSAFTSFCGFKVNDGEYKLMGLAPYGEPRFVPLIEDQLIKIEADGSFRLNPRYFSYAHGRRMTNHHFAQLFGGTALPLGAIPTAREMDLAASIQQVIEKVVRLAAQHLRRQTGANNLCLGGGVALNCVANGLLEKAGIFEHIWVPPAPDDAGSALGAALACWYGHLNQPRKPDTERLHGGYLGPGWSASQVETTLNSLHARYTPLAEDILLDRTANLLAAGKVVGWFQDRMEFGPRALGHRSILADPRDAGMIRRLNLAIKKRESFRPFAPSVLAEHASDWFDLGDSPFMNKVANVTTVQNAGPALHDLTRINANRSAIPAVTHVDGTARLHTVTAAGNPLFYRLLKRFQVLTGVPLLVNTSFNVRDEPIVASPTDAWRCFMNTDMDALVIGHCLLLKTEQPPVSLSALPAPPAPKPFPARPLLILLATLFIGALLPWLTHRPAGTPQLLLGLVLGITDWRLPKLTAPFWKVLEKLGHVISIGTNTFLLALLYGLFITPSGLWRQFRQRPLRNTDCRKHDNIPSSFYHPADPLPPKHMERPF